MIIVLAHIADERAASFANEFPSARASVVTCHDIAAKYTYLCHPDFNGSTITAGGRRVGVGTIEGIVNLLSSVSPAEILFYPPEEREYQATEMHALLTFVLSALKCPVVNRPTTISFNGPVFNPIGWYHLADEANIPLSEITIKSGSFQRQLGIEKGDILETTYLGGDIIKASGSAADAYTAKLARHAGVGYLKARYFRRKLANIQFAGANSTPDIKCDITRKALINHFSRGPS